MQLVGNLKERPMMMNMGYRKEITNKGVVEEKTELDCYFDDKSVEKS